MTSRSATFTGDAVSVSAARRFVTTALEELGGQPAAWAATLVVSELATNAMLHARSSMTITVSVNGTVRLEVGDSSAAVPRMRAYDEHSTTGRGMRLVQELSSSWGVEQVATGKVVWVELDLAGGAEPVATAGAHGSAAPDAVDGDLSVEALLAMFEDGSDDDSLARPARGRAPQVGRLPFLLTPIRLAVVDAPPVCAAAR